MLVMVDADRRKVFGEALAQALAARGVTQRALGDLLGGTAQSVIAGWRSGAYEPDVDTVFEIERVLELPPGNLSRHLGYFPPAAIKKGAPTFEETVLNDPLLDDTMKNGLIAQYKAWTAARRRRRRSSGE